MGWSTGVFCAAYVFHKGASGHYYLWSVLSFFFAKLGSTAPDWLEIAWWSRKKRLWLPHRSLTHWGVAWAALLYFAATQVSAATPWASLLFGFAVGGLTHLLADWPNPLGVPWLYRRHSLGLWKSGAKDLFIVIASWLSTLAYVDEVWFFSVHGKNLILAMVRHLEMMKALI